MIFRRLAFCYLRVEITGCSLFNVKVGSKIIEFALAVVNSSPASVRRLEIDLIARTEEEVKREEAIIDQMLSIFHANCPFYELKWYEM